MDRRIAYQSKDQEVLVIQTENQSKTQVHSANIRDVLGELSDGLDEIGKWLSDALEKLGLKPPELKKAPIPKNGGHTSTQDSDADTYARLRMPRDWDR